MSWCIDFSGSTLKFLDHNNLKENVIIDEVKLAIRKFQGEGVNINIQKLHGKWSEFYRIRSGKLRIILAFQFEVHRVYIEKVDWRGGAYK